MYIWHIHMIDYMIITVPTIPPSLVFKILHCWFNLFFEGVNHHFPWCSIFVPGISHSCPLSFHSIRWTPAFQWFLVGPTRLLPQDGRHSWRSQAHHKCVYSIYIYIHTHTISYNHTIIMWPTLLLICFSVHFHTMIRINDSRFLQLLLHIYIYYLESCDTDNHNPETGTHNPTMRHHQNHQWLKHIQLVDAKHCRYPPEPPPI